jgi:CHASE1-domain containing sensor protein
VKSRAKLLAAIRNNPKDVRFADACKAARWLGFVGRAAKGDHHVFQRPGEATALNFQNRKGRIKPYQARQLIEMMNKYESPTDDNDIDLDTEDENQ